MCWHESLHQIGRLGVQEAQHMEWVDDVLLFMRKGGASPQAYQMAAPLLADIATSLKARPVISLKLTCFACNTFAAGLPDCLRMQAQVMKMVRRGCLMLHVHLCYGSKFVLRLEHSHKTSCRSCHCFASTVKFTVLAHVFGLS